MTEMFHCPQCLIKNDGNVSAKKNPDLYTGEEFETISNFLIGNRFHVTLRIVSPTTLLK